MRIHVLLFGPLAEIYATREEWIELPNSPSAADVYRHYQQRDPRIGELQKSLHIAINQTIVAPNHPLAPNDEVALLPPVCGGAPDSDLIDLVETPLETYPWRTHLNEATGNFGAITAFEGLVRQDPITNDLAGNPVTALAFEAYRPMALTALHQIATEAHQRWPIHALVMLHRLGTVPAGEICVVTAVATGHREAAFAACKFLIDSLKATVPLWKKEITASSSGWVEGVLLPAANVTSE
jgi:molybdopterin synthase catalytic subunit/molybdopterin converting factor small subunit